MNKRMKLHWQKNYHPFFTSVCRVIKMTVKNRCEVELINHFKSCNSQCSLGICIKDHKEQNVCFSSLNSLTIKTKFTEVVKEVLHIISLNKRCLLQKFLRLLKTLHPCSSCRSFGAELAFSCLTLLFAVVSSFY